MSTYCGKRTLDLLVSGAACIVFAPLVVFVAVATKLEDGGPALFLQTRLGQYRRPFTIFKFRSMRNQEITGIGRWLRRTAVDEWPQFINVVRGEMSVVGPRPLVLNRISSDSGGPDNLTIGDLPQNRESRVYRNSWLGAG